MEAGRDKQISWVRGERGRDRQRNIVENTGPDMKIRNEDHLLRYEPNPSTSHLVFGSSQNPGRTREPSGLHQLTLENLIKLIDDRVEPSEIFRSIIDPDNVLTNNLKENLNNFDYLETVLVVIGRFCAKNGASLFADGFVTVVKTLADQNVFAQSSSIIIHIPMSSSSVLPSKEQRLKRLTSAICSIVTEVLVVMPSFGCGCFGRNFLSDILYLEAIPSVKMLNLSGVFDEVEDCIHLLETTFKRYIAPKKGIMREVSKEKHTCKTEMDLHEPPNDFRTLKVVPSWGDVCVDVEPFLRPNVVERAFPNVSTYLDIQFRLLREDFFYPLRLGILSYKYPSQARYKRGSNNIWIYHNVHIVEHDMNKSMYTIQFSTGRLQKIDWKKSKRLVDGSLVCLSSNNFSSFHVFTVAERDDVRLADGKIRVTYEGDKLTLRDKKRTYTMAESIISFEPYRCVLTALQKTSPAHFPLQDYILGVKCVATAPEYLSQSTQPMYDLTWTRMISNFTRLKLSVTSTEDGIQTNLRPSVIVKVSDYKVMINQGPDKPQNSADGDPNNKKDKVTEMNQDKGLEYLISRFRRVAILNPDNRPDSDNLGLDASQTTAFYAALTRKISVIQGPPGTGKTYLGLRIIETFLKNKNYWMGEQSAPVLVICFTNNTLDQFLKRILQFTQNLVYLGGQSKCETLEPFTLDAWKKRSDSGSRLNTKRWIFDIENRLQELEKERILVNAVLQVVNTSGLIHPKVLLGMNIISESVLNNIDNLLHPFHRLVIIQNEWTPLGYWLSIYSNRALEALLQHFNQNHLVTKSRSKEPRLQQPSSKPEIPKELSSLDNDHIEDVVEEVIEEDHDYLATIKAIKPKKMSSDLLKDVFSNFTYSFHNDGEKITNLEILMGKLDAQNAAKLQMKINELQRKMILFHQLVEIVPPASKQQVEDWSGRDLNKILLPERWMMYSSWKIRSVENLGEQVKKIEESLQHNTNRLKDVRDLEWAEICKHSAVIGLTTTMAAKQRTLLNHLNPKIVIVKEAAEILDANVVCSLPSCCQQLILIGDHHQLRPPVETFRLVKDFDLDVSLFERLIENGMEPCVLDVQHRMRPEITRLIVPSIYPNLKNNSSVFYYPDVRGMSTNVFFLTHTEPELSGGDAKSYLNPYEAELCLGLARHFILQGYRPSQITILTIYSGQLVHFWKIHGVGSFGCQSVRIAVVDNFKGEENDIIILSIVRSNEDDNIGFLRIENRIGVALSRARLGFYMIGNKVNLKRTSKQWNSIIRDLKAMEQLGPDLPLKCQIHGIIFKARQVSDFPLEGGCMEMCGVKMNCGHVCPKICHNSDRQHTAIECQQSCQRLCPSGHRCPKVCFEPC